MVIIFFINFIRLKKQSCSLRYGCSCKKEACVDLKRSDRITMNDKPQDFDKLVKDIVPLAEKLKAIEKLAKSLGMFLNDRKLLTCSDCGIEEDVLIDGRLIVCPISKPDQITGLEFCESEKNDLVFICPMCKKKIIIDKQ